MNGIRELAALIERNTDAGIDGVRETAIPRLSLYRWSRPAGPLHAAYEPYQKHLRLHEARRLMLSQAVDAAVGGHSVGYESPSQFSREYRRLFGAPPARDIARFRAGEGASSGMAA